MDSLLVLQPAKPKSTFKYYNNRTPLMDILRLAIAICPCYYHLMAKKRDDAGMQAKLMNAAMTAFSRKGLNDCRMSDIADDAGLARGTAYLYFKSKEQLMLSMYKLYSSKIIKSQKAMLAQAGDLTARQLLDRACQACLRSGISHRRTFGLWFQFLALGSSPSLGKAVRNTLAENYRGHSDYLEELVEKGRNSGEFRKNTNSRAVAAALVGLLEGLMIRQYADSELTNLAVDYSEMVCVILDGISAKVK
jgi:TetR/AcrR family transcriptional regulator, fatty acid metabolism regulator protein